MNGFYERRWSRSALWCQRIAWISFFYFAITILLHRFDKVTTPQLFWLLAFGLVLLALGLLLGARAVLELWSDGRRGGRATMRGVFLLVLLVLPFVWAGWLAVRYPPLNDIATSPNAPAFIEIAGIRAAGEAEGMNPLASYEGGYGELVGAAYPAVTSRRYDAGVERIYAVVRVMFENRDWTVVAVRGAPADDGSEDADEELEGAPRPTTRGEGLISQAPGDIEIEGVASSLIFGFKTDVVVRIVAEVESTLVDMRAANRYGPHDLGSNGRLIENFMSNLDKALAGLAGEG